MRASSALALGVVLCTLLLAAPAAAKRANSPKPKPDPPIEVEDIGEDELPPARPKSEKFDEREYHQYEQHKHDFEAELAKKFPKQNEVPLTEDMKTRIMEEKLKEVLKEDSKKGVGGSEKERAADLMKKLSQQFQRVMGEKAKKGYKDGDLEKHGHEESITSFAFAKTLHQLKEEFSQHPEIFEQYDEIMKRPLAQHHFTKADSWAVVGFLLQFGDAAGKGMSAAVSERVTKRFSELLSSNLEELRTEHMHTAYRRAPRKPTGNSIGAVCKLLKELHEMKALKPDYVSAAYMASALKLSKGWDEVSLDELEIGDVAIFPPTPNHPRGHVQIKTAQGWLSDYKQRDSLYPEDEFEMVKPTVYRKY